MRIFYDVSSLCGRRITGIGIYIRSLHEALRKQLNAGDALLPRVKLSRAHKKKLTALHGISNAGIWVPGLSGGRNDILHGPDFRLLSDSPKLRKLITVHDLCVCRESLVEPDFAAKGRQHITHVLRKLHPDHLIADSEFTAAEIRHFFPEYSEKISVVPLAPGETGAGSGRKMAEWPYLLFVGTLEKRKNIEGMVRAFSLLSGKYGDLRMVMIGAEGYDFDRVKLLRQTLPGGERIIFPGFVSRTELADWYAGAEMFVYFSHYEGFGIPILEAMVRGLPVVTSNRGAMKEAAGDAAVLADPDSPEDMMAAMEKVMNSADLAAKLKVSGRDRVNGYSWEKTARETLAAYGRVPEK